MLEEALRSRCDLPAVLASDAVIDRLPELPGSTRRIALPADLFESIATTETSQGVVALVKLPAWTLDALWKRPSLIAVLDGVQDPGNAGTIVRAAEAFGASGLIFLKGTAHPHNPKTLRASAGSLFRMPFVDAITPAEMANHLKAGQRPVFAAVPFDGKQRLATDVDLRRCTLLIGSEGRGLSPELSGCGEPIAIPTHGVESLNAGVAASILFYEAQRQRSGRTA